MAAVGTGTTRSFCSHVPLRQKFLLFGALYVLCTIGLARHESSLIVGSISRWMQVQEEASFDVNYSKSGAKSNYRVSEEPFVGPSTTTTTTTTSITPRHSQEGVKPETNTNKIEEPALAKKKTINEQPEKAQGLAKSKRVVDKPTTQDASPVVQNKPKKRPENAHHEHISTAAKPSSKVVEADKDKKLEASSSTSIKPQGEIPTKDKTSQTDPKPTPKPGTSSSNKVTITATSVKGLESNSDTTISKLIPEIETVDEKPQSDVKLGQAKTKTTTKTTPQQTSGKTKPPKDTMSTEPSMKLDANQRIEMELNSAQTAITKSQMDSENNMGDHEEPIFVFSLPGPGSLATSRYFKCNMENSRDVNFYWAVRENKNGAIANSNHANLLDPAWTLTRAWQLSRVEIGRCIQQNLKAKRPFLEGCGNAKVWTSMGFVTSSDQQCFFPSLDEIAMESLARTYPKATILQITQDPGAWYDGSSLRFRQNFASYCPQVHQGMIRNKTIPFPSTRDKRQEWMEFYQWYQDSIRDFAASHPSLKYIEVPLEAPDTGSVLNEKLGFTKSCWTPPNLQPYDPVLDTGLSKRKNKLPFPIFVASLPKSGTTSTQRFFQCGLSWNDAGHHWTNDPITDEPVKIGKCIQGNIQQNRSIFHDCGDFKVWTDTGYMDEPWAGKNKPSTKGESLGCFFPTMHGGLEAFYESHPNGTVINVVRDAKQWYESAVHWRNLPDRMSKQCSGEFPPVGSKEDEWVNFYQWHTQHVRDFAQNHPSLTYLELSLEDPNIGKILQDETGIPDVCWGNCNPDKSKGSCGVFKKKKDYTAKRGKISARRTKR